MEVLIIILLLLVAAETSYLTYKSIPKAHVDKHSLLCDTSVLIDGRILPIVRSGLVTAPLIVPRSVVRELQYMADKADHDKRERAREGLDMIEQLRTLDSVELRVIDDKSDETGVDERLIELAQQYGARLCTIDYNLNKAARVQGVDVVNINEIAHALRVVHLPGETISVKLVQVGQESRQAVGYLDDGTMVVVDDAKSLIGESVDVEVTRVLQTTAGKMMFAKKAGAPSQTRGEGRSRTFARKDETRSEVRTDAVTKPFPKARSESRSRSRASDKDTGRAPMESRATTPKPPVQTNGEASQPIKQQPRKQFPRNNRRSSPEDTLVNLANRE